jgi:hypothetical protein
MYISQLLLVVSGAYSVSYTLEVGGYLLVVEMVRLKPSILSTARVENAWSFKADIFMAYFYVQE